jgi:hypothetical protein
MQQKTIFISALFTAFVLFGRPLAAEESAASQNMAPSLTDYVKETDDKKPETTSENQSAEQNNSEDEKTWINSLVNKVAQKGAQIINPDMSDELTPKRRSNASVFDVSGVMLRMNTKQADEALTKRGYKKTAEKFEIPNFIRWRFEEMCRGQGVVGYERLESCVVQMSKKNNYLYIQHQNYNNFRTQESVELFYTSNFTGNKVYRIAYHSEAANIKGNSAKANYLRNIKIYDFWKQINQKYGVPDNQEQVVWGLGENKPYLKASTGYLLLADPMLVELDYTRMSREDQKFMNTGYYTF